jgi:hypothetical protein
MTNVEFSAQEYRLRALAIYHPRGQNRTSARSSDQPDPMSVYTLQKLLAGNQ